MTETRYDQKQIPASVRKQVLDRDNYRCRRCGTEENLTIHHIDKRSLGADHNPDRLVTVCWIPCHRMLEDHEIDVKRIRGEWFFTG